MPNLKLVIIAEAYCDAKHNNMNHMQKIFKEKILSLQPSAGLIQNVSLPFIL